MTKKADPQNLDTWTKYKKGLCKGCWAMCCTLPVEVNAKDLVRLELITEDEAQWPLELVETRLRKNRVIQAFDYKSKKFILAQVSGRDCLYLHPTTRQCTVYEKRPDTCRSFPKIGPKSGFCPYTPDAR